MFTKKTVRDIEVAGKRVLMRVDFNVPLSEGTVTDDTRIRAALPTIQYLLDKGARLILCSHLGRPSGEGFEEKFSLAPAARVLSKLIDRPVQLVDDLAGEKALAAAEALQDGEVILLENTRFDKREKKNNPELSEALAKLADIYVNDAFGTAHRAHCTTEGVAHYLPAVAGLLLEKEVDTLTGMLAEPEHPFVAILGGSKVSDKIGVIESLLDRCDKLLIGGGMCFTFLAAKGYATGTSLKEEDWIEHAAKMMEKAAEKGVELILPVDVVCSEQFAENDNPTIVAANEIPENMMGLDIGPDSVALYAEAIQSGKTIFWNGPMGVFEMKSYEAGTKAVAQAVAKNSLATSIIGGGDSVAAVKKFNLEDGITFISTGGGASMELVEGKALPGVVALLDA